VTSKKLRAIAEPHEALIRAGILTVKEAA